MEIEHLNTLEEYHKRFGLECHNPWVGIVDFRKAPKCENGNFYLGFYLVKLKIIPTVLCSVSLRDNLSASTCRRGKCLPPWGCCSTRIC